MTGCTGRGVRDGEEETPQATGVDAGGCRSRHLSGHPSPAGQRDGIEDILAEALPLRDEHVRLLCTVLRKSQEGDNLEGAAIFAYQLGRLIERASVLQHEPAALTGKKCRSGGAAGAQAKRLTPDEKQAKTDLYQAGLEALRKKHPNLKQEALIHKLARQLGQGHSVRTIKTYLPKSK